MMLNWASKHAILVGCVLFSSACAGSLGDTEVGPEPSTVAVNSSPVHSATAGTTSQGASPTSSTSSVQPGAVASGNSGDDMLPKKLPSHTVPDWAKSMYGDPTVRAGMKLGMPCSSDKTEGALSAYCGPKGTYSLVIDTRSSLLKEAACKQPIKGPNVVTYSTSACITDDQMVISNECMMCRMPNQGWSLVANIAQITNEQREMIKKQANITTSSALHTRQEWHDALTIRVKTAEKL